MRYLRQQRPLYSQYPEPVARHECTLAWVMPFVHAGG